MLKKIITTAVLAGSSLGMMGANAATPGVYVTGQLGYADTHMQNRVGYTWNTGDELTKLNKLSNNGLAGRVAVGYQFNPNFALEAGYLNVAGKSYTGPIVEHSKTADYKFQLGQYAYDLNAKGILPVSDQLNVYAKAGIAYLTTTLDQRAVGDSHADYDLAINTPRRVWAPEAAVGVSYDITPNLPIDLSWTHIQTVGNKNKDTLGNIDFVAVGLGYHFG